MVASRVVPRGWWLSRYLFVFNPRGRDGPAWEHVALGHPGGPIPALDLWHELCECALKDAVDDP